MSCCSKRLAPLLVVFIGIAARAQDTEAVLVQQGQQALRAEEFSRAAGIFESAVQRFPASKPAYSPCEPAFG